MTERRINMFGHSGCLGDNDARCTACCSVFEIRELNKPEDTLCGNTRIQKGCLVHNTKDQPPTCRGFHCSMLFVTMATQGKPIEDRKRAQFDAGILTAQALQNEEITEDTFRQTQAAIETAFAMGEHGIGTVRSVIFEDEQ